MSEYYALTMTSVRPGSLPLDVGQMTLSEVQGWGWTGSLVFTPPEEVFANHIGGIFGWLGSRGMLAGDSVIIKLLPQPSDDDESTESENEEGVAASLPGRVWPCVLSKISVVPAHSETNPARSLCRISVSDPLTYLFARPIWGSFSGYSPGEMLGGAMSLANGGDGAPVLNPILDGMPLVRIFQHIRADLSEIPYAIAAGETLGEWVTYLLGRFGARLELKGDRHGHLGIEIKDLSPIGDPLPLTLTSGSEQAVSRTQAILLSMRYASAPLERGAVLDNLATGDVRRLVLETGSVGSIVDAPQTSVSEAELRAGFDIQRANLQQFLIRVATGHPAVAPGQLIRFSDEEAIAESLWQAGNVTHRFRGRIYQNAASIYVGETAFRPPVVPQRSRSLIVSAVVDDGESEIGTPIAHDHLNRIPVRFSFAQEADPNAELAANWPPRQMLTVLEQMAGKTHGFLPVHRQGDVCRVAVRHPLFAEVIGFSYRDNLRVGEDLVDTSAGVVVQHGEDAWSGLIFRPRVSVEEEEAAAAEGRSEE